LSFTKDYSDLEYISLQKNLQAADFEDSAQSLLKLHVEGWQKIVKHGDYKRWSAGLDALPDIASQVSLAAVVAVSSEQQHTFNAKSIHETLQTMHPWRKGPFEVFGVSIDTEWRSDWKWERVLPHISALKGRSVLDIGCGSGYHLWRMLEQDAKLAIGIDPTPLFSFHFACIKRYAPHCPSFLIPTGIDEMPDNMQSFDTIFSMGILYHRRSPLDHLYKIKGLLKKGGELVLETLIVDGDEHTCLMPSGRYAKMRNVWFIPSVAMLELWLKRAGFKDVRCVDVNTTSTEEQRSTAWMTFESLADFLDPNDATKTIEGYPAPKRVVMVATL